MAIQSNDGSFFLGIELLVDVGELLLGGAAIHLVLLGDGRTQQRQVRSVL